MKEINKDQLKPVNTLALENYKDFIRMNFSGLRNLEFISTNFIENLLDQIKAILGDVPDKKIAEILYHTSDGSEALAFATLKHTKNDNPNSLIDENLLDIWFLNLKREFPRYISTFFNMIHNYKLIYAEKCVFDLVDKWDSYCIKVQNRGLNMETKMFDFIKSALKGILIEEMSFILSCGIPNHKKFLVHYKHLYRAVCSLCSRIEKSLSYQDFVREVEQRNAKLGFTKSEFIDRITKEFNKPRDKQLKVSEILFPFICNKHGKLKLVWNVLNLVFGVQNVIMIEAD
ncbi:MAG: hypothetical protein EU529_07365 [Promethearchaeota archaeon]|nr:MAG: hypothetical protein EU529_07365 [Candidatus Lokiarchaeota archaeon]